jgi:hypothetical protein
MSSISDQLDEALRSLEAQGLTPVTIVLPEPEHEALASIATWPVTTSSSGELRYRSTPVFKARAAEGRSIVGRGEGGVTRRVRFGDRPG